MKLYRMLLCSKMKIDPSVTDGSSGSVGIGLIAWRIEGEASTPELTEGFIATIIDARPAAIWLSFGECPENLNPGPRLMRLRAMKEWRFNDG